MRGTPAGAHPVGPSRPRCMWPSSPATQGVQLWSESFGIIAKAADNVLPSAVGCGPRPARGRPPSRMAAMFDCPEASAAATSDPSMHSFMRAMHLESLRSTSPYTAICPAYSSSTPARRDGGRANEVGGMGSAYRACAPGPWYLAPSAATTACARQDGIASRPARSAAAPLCSAEQRGSPCGACTHGAAGRRCAA